MFQNILLSGILVFFFSCATEKPTKKVDNPYQNVPEEVLNAADSGFGGFYLDIEKVMKLHQVSRGKAHEIQNQMRDELEISSGSFSAVEQKPFLKQALKNAIDSVKTYGVNESQFRPRPLKAGEFYLVLDMDETFLTQWYKAGQGEGASRKGHIAVSVRDIVVSAVDRKTGTSKDKNTILMSPAMITIRPKFETFMSRVKKLKGYKGFIVFTAKEDKAAWDIVHRWKKKDPKLFKDLKGVYTRNYLKWGKGFKKPSKDLRIIDPSLRHAFLIDDNESRVLQTELNYRIPKFNADFFWNEYKQSKAGNEAWIFDRVFDYIYTQLKACQGPDFVACASKRLGYEKDERKGYYAWLKSILPRISIDNSDIEKRHVFHQKFHVDLSRELSEDFPEFKDFKLVP
jgi:hypothetical protein